MKIISSIPFRNPYQVLLVKKDKKFPMKYIKPWICAFIIIILNHFILKGQDQAGAFIKAGAADANKLGKAYLNPLMNGFGVGFSQGWASRADVRAGHVDIKFLGGLSFIPISEQIFDANQLGLSSMVKVNGAGISPTVSGLNQAGAALDLYETNPITGQPQKISSLNSPSGTGYNFIPIAVPQVSVGLPFGTGISVRAIPNLTIGNASLGVYGGSLIHDISSHFPIIPLHFGILAGFTQVNLQYGLKVQPDPGASTNPQSDYSHQKLNLKSNSLTLGFIVSKTFAILTLHGGINYNHSTGLLTATGTYPITTYGLSGNPQTTDIKDPINIQGDQLSYLSASAGIQLKLGFFSILAEGTTGHYTSVNGGIGLSF